MGQHPRRAGNAILALVVVSVALLSLAIAGYPGGTSFDRGARGHDVWRNFVCDLTAPVALNGVANPQGAALASLALLGLGVALALFWWHLSALAVPSVRTRRVVRVAGLVSSLALIMAFLVAQTRVESGVHSALEVASGGLLGALAALVVFQVFS